MYADTNGAKLFEQLCNDLKRCRVQRVHIQEDDGMGGRSSGISDDGSVVVTAVQFVREFVMRSTPCIIHGMMDSWPAMSKWCNDDYFFGHCGGADVTVAMTPTGRADCVTRLTYLPVKTTDQAETETLFMAPAECRMKLSTVAELLRRCRKKKIMDPLVVDLTRDREATVPIPYCQLQKARGTIEGRC
jgi:hypothetical protein